MNIQTGKGGGDRTGEERQKRGEREENDKKESRYDVMISNREAKLNICCLMEERMWMATGL